MSKCAKKTLAVCLATLLTACGGSDGGSLAERYLLEAQADVWENHMPTVLFPGQQPSCTSLMVRFKVTSPEGALPSGLLAESVSLSKNGTVFWTQTVSTTETGLTNEQTLEGIARGCKTTAFAAGDDLDVKVLVKANHEQSEVPAVARLLYAF